MAHGEVMYTTNPTMLPEDLYKDIHKAIRVNLFEVTADAGRLDPDDRAARIVHAARVRDLVDFLVFHAHHEDTHMEDGIRQVLPAEADAIAAEHVALEATMAELQTLAALAFDEVGTGARAQVHELYLALASFTSRYLAHQEVEERVVMPALFAAFGLEAMLAMHGAILASIPPDEMAWGLAKMLPAINVLDRVAMLAGMRAQAPAPVFEGVLGLAADVLTDADHAQLVARLAVPDLVAVAS